MYFDDKPGNCGEVMKRRHFLERLFLFILAGHFVHGAYGQEKRDFSRWEKAIAAFEQQDKKQPPPKDPVVFVGSSSIRFWDLAKSFPDLPAINRGFGGSELADSVHFAARIVLKYEPRLIVLYAGDNDIATAKTPEHVCSDFQSFARVIHDKLPKSRIIYLSIKPSPLRWGSIDRIRKTNALIEAECKKNDRLLYLDVATPMLGNDGKPRRELFGVDGLHLNAKGYALWAERLKPYLSASRTDAPAIDL